MSKKVKFEEEYSLSEHYIEKTSGLTALVIKLGLAKNEEKVNKILLFIIGISILLTFFIFIFMNKDKSENETTIDPDEIIRLENTF